MEASIQGRFIQNYLAEMAMVWIPIGIYNTMPYYTWFLNPRLQASLALMAAVYTFYGWRVAQSKAEAGQPTKGVLMAQFLLHAWKVIFLRSKETASPEARTAFLTFWVKFYFIPVMLNFSYRNLANLKYYTLQLMHGDLDLPGISYFNAGIFPLLVSLCYITLTAIYLFGYVVETPYLNNRVKSVDATFTGWAVTLICYPPFSNEFSRHIPFEININAFFGSEWLTFWMRLFMLLMMGVMFWSVAVLGTRCSNLTNRGIVTSGPYRLIRHPHYVAKNIMWWCTILPVIPTQPVVVLFMAIWTAIYLLRGITEEKHLLNDPEYRSYCEKVRWKFVPGLW